MRERALRVLDREVSLMFLQRRDQHLARQREEALVEPTLDGDRPLDECRDFIEQCVVHHGAATAGRSHGEHLLADALAPFCEAGDDEARTAQDVGVVRRRIDVDFTGSVEAMSARTRAGIRVEQTRLQGLVAESHHDPMNGPHELGIAATPAHALRDRQAIESALDDGRQQRRRGGTGLAALELQKLSLALGHATERFERDTAALGERGRRTRRCARFVERRVDGRAAPLDPLHGLHLGECTNEHGQPAGRGVGDDTVVGEGGGIETCAKALGQCALEFGQGERRQFFGAEFEQEIASAHGAPPPAAPVAFTIGKPRASRLS